jgi:hypothetical protein
MNIEQMSAGYKRSALRSRLKSAALLFLTLFLVILRSQSVLGQRLKTQLNAPGTATGTFPFGVNTSEAVVGSHVNTSGATSGFLYADGKYTTLDYPGSDNFTRASGINDFNEVVGDFLGSDNSYHGYTYVGGAYMQYDVDKGVVSTSLFGINNAGHLVGSQVSLDTLVAEGFTDIGGAVTTFYGSGTDPTYAYAINTSDEVVGRYYDSSNKSHGFYRDARGTITEIAYPGATQTECFGINDAGEITGNYVDISGISRGFMDIKGKFATTGFYSTAGINSNGVFVGYYFGVGAVASGYLASAQSFRLTDVTIPKEQQGFLYDNPGVSTGNYVASNGTPHGTTIATGTVNNNNEDKKSDAVTSSNPGGSSGDIQYNNSGTFGGSPNLFWDNTNGTVTITKTSTSSQSGLDVTVPTGQDSQYSIRAFTTAAHHSALTADVVIGNGVSTRDAIVVSGTTSGSGTSYAIKAPTSDPTMLALWSDVTGPAEIIASSTATLGNNLLYGVLDGGGGTGVNKFYTLEIDPFGSYFMGSSTNTSNTGWDTGFSRIGAGVTGFGNGTRLSTSGTVETTNFISVPRGTATGSTQFSSGTLSLEGSYWTGSAANTDAWNITGSHGGFRADAAQVLTVTPTNPQAQTPQMNLDAALVLNSGSLPANSLISLTDANSNIGFFSNNNNNPQGILSWYLDNGTRKWTVGTNFLTSNDFEFSNGSADLVVINHTSGAIRAPAYISAGTTFTATGCGTPRSLTGGATAGSFLAQATSCTVTVTMGNLAKAPNGWSCSVWDVTTTADTLKEIAFTTTAVTFSGAVASGDKIIFGCIGF